MSNKLNPWANDNEFAKMMSDVMNARNRAQYLYKLLGWEQNTKAALKGYIQRLNFILDDFKRRLPDKFREQFTENILNEEDTMQADAVISMFINLPKDVRDQVEKQLEELGSVHCKEEAA
jgi:hypothetical protein